jgi:hypothetical protein
MTAGAPPRKLLSTSDLYMSSRDLEERPVSAAIRRRGAEIGSASNVTGRSVQEQLYPYSMRAAACEAAASAAHLSGHTTQRMGAVLSALSRVPRLATPSSSVQHQRIYPNHRQPSPTIASLCTTPAR